MKKSNTALFIISLGINLAVAHVLKLTITFQQVLTIHIFLFALFFLTNVIQTKLSKHKKISPSLVLSINFSRMFVCIIFLLPSILTHEKSENGYIYNFFGVYFFILFSDIFLKRKNHNKING